MWKCQPPAVGGASAAAGATGAAGACGAIAGATGSYGIGRVAPPVFTRPCPPLSWWVAAMPGCGWGTTEGLAPLVSIHTRAPATTASASAAAIQGRLPDRTVLGAWTSTLALMASSSAAGRTLAVRNLVRP